MDLKNIMTYMRNNVGKNYKIEEIAANFGYSKFDFSKKFKKEAGFSASRFFSFLKIEKALYQITMKKEKIITSQIYSGYKSSGTFTNLFVRYTGMTPTNYKKNLNFMYTVITDYIENIKTQKSDSLYINKEEIDISKKYNNQVKLKLLYPQNYTSAITFIGFFRTPLPESPPLLSKIIIPHLSNYECIFSNIPDGEYYILGFSIEEGAHFLNFFYLGEAFRSIIKDSIIFPENNISEITLYFRQSLPSDFPILISLPKIISEINRK